MLPARELRADVIALLKQPEDRAALRWDTTVGKDLDSFPRQAGLGRVPTRLRLRSAVVVVDVDPVAVCECPVEQSRDACVEEDGPCGTACSILVQELDELHSNGDREHGGCGSSDVVTQCQHDERVQGRDGEYQQQNR